MKKVIPSDAILIPDSATRAFEGAIFDVYQWQQELYDGSYDTFEMLKRPDTTSVLCVVDDKLIVLDEEQPNNVKRRSFPGGRIDPEDESVVSAAQREVQEETGYSFANWRLIKVVQPIKKLEWFIYYVVAWDVTGKIETAHEPGEKILEEHLTFNEVKQLAEQKAGFIHEVSDLLAQCHGVRDICNLPEYSGKEVDR